MVDVCFGILMELLKKRKVTAAYLAEKFEISTRSVYRYVDVLSANNVAIFCTRGRSGGIQIADNYRLPAGLLSAAEQEDIFSALSLLKAAKPQTDVEKIRDKFLAVNSAEQMGNLVMSTDKLMVEGVIGDGALYQSKIEPLSAAIDKNVVVRIVYHDRGGVISDRLIQPHAFVLKDFVWYVYAYCELRKGFRMFKISRIEKLSFTDTVFERKNRAEFTPWNFNFTSSFESVDLMFYLTESVRYTVEEWLSFECVKPQNNSDFPYIATATVQYDENLISRLMSFGGNVKIISPTKIKNALIDAATQLINIY